MREGVRARLHPSRKQGALVLCLAIFLVMACSPSLSKHPASGREDTGTAASSLADRILTSADEGLFYEGIVHLGVSGQAADYEKAKKVFTQLLHAYPKSKWCDPANTCLRLIDERKALIESGISNQTLIANLRKEKAEALQDKERLRLTNEKLLAEVTRFLQENEQLKKDIQLLKDLEIQLEKRDRLLR